MTRQVIGPGATLGILGGGQLARMLALAAADYGLRCHIFAPESDSPAFDVAARHTIASYDDDSALRRFAEDCAVVTYEFENVPAATASVLAGSRPLRPNAQALATTQDRLVEKTFVASLGIAVAPFLPVSSLPELEAAVVKLGRPSILKTRCLGYDGKGQCKILHGTDLREAFAEMGGQPAILEGFVPFVREASVVAARGADGTFVAYDLCENEHADHILALTRVPARVGATAASSAIAAATRIADALDYVGVLAVELFVVGEGKEERVIVNEIAPRVHNSGHWTSEGAETSQFHQHVRAICGLPLGSALKRGGNITMQNLVGSESDNWLALLGEAGAHLHLYGKDETRPGRKMGHVTRIEKAGSLG